MTFPLVTLVDLMVPSAPSTQVGMARVPVEGDFIVRQGLCYRVRTVVLEIQPVGNAAFVYVIPEEFPHGYPYGHR